MYEHLYISVLQHQVPIVTVTVWVGHYIIISWHGHYIIILWQSEGHNIIIILKKKQLWHE